MDLRGQKIKDTYGNVITIGSTAGAPSSGELTNGQDTPFTGLFTGGNFGVGSLPQGNATRSVLRIGKSGGDDGGLINFFDGTASLGSIYTDSTGSLFINADPEAVTASSSIRFSIDGSAPALAIDNNQRIGVGTTSPTQALHVVGGARIQGAIYDSSNSAGTSGQLLSSTGTGTAWTSGGYITSIGLTAPTGFTVANSPITSSGTLALSFSSGYSLPTNSSQTNWTSAYNNMITAASFSTETGVVTLTQQDAGTVTVDIDGRYILESEKGANSGVATLDASGKIPSYQLPTSVFVYKGLWNASTNTPTLSNGTGSVGEVYKCNVAGTVNFGAGDITFAVNDLALYDGSVWQKSDSTDDVLSVNSQTGVVVLTTSDIAEGTNQYFTTARARTSVSAGDGMSYSSSTGVITNADKGSSQNIFKSVAVAGEDTITADANDDTLTFVAGSGVTLATDASTDAITISATGTGGTLTSVDMTVPTGFTVSGNPITTSGTLAVSFDTGYALPTTASQANWTTAYNRSPTALAYNTSSGIITLTKEDATTLTATVTLAPFTTSTLTEGTNLYFTDSRARSAISAGTGISYSSATGVITNSAPDQTVVLTAGTGISTSGTYPNFTITNSDRGSSQNIFKNVAVSGQTTLSADANDDTLTVASGTGISLSTNSTTDTLTITNSAPDQTVVLTAGTGISTSGTYPNFTITNSAPDQTVSITASTGMSVTGTYPSFTVENTDRGSSQSIFKNIAVSGQSTVVADSNNDTLTLVAGNNITITTNATTDTITIDSPDAGGTVTSVAATGGTGISVSGSPITTSGTLTISSTATLSDVTGQGSSTSTTLSLNGGINYSGGTNLKKSWVSLASGAGTQKYKLYDNTNTTDGYANIKIYRAYDQGDGATESATQDIIFSRRNTGAQYRYRVEGDASTVAEVYVEFYLQTDNHIEAWLVAEDYCDAAIEITYSNGSVISSLSSGTPAGTLEFTTDPDTTVPNQDFWVGKMFVNSAAATTDTDKFLVQDGNEVKYRTGAQVRSDIGAGTGDGSVTSVAMTVPTGFSISGSPITTSGTLALGFSSGYSLPSTSSQTNWNTAYNDSITAFAYNTSNGILTLTQQDAGTLTATVTLAPFTTANLTEGSNLYFTNARARSAISLTTTGTSGAATYNSGTGVLNIPQYQSALTNPVTGTGTTNYVTKWTSGSAVGNSSIFDNGNVGIGTASPSNKLDVVGSILAQSSGYVHIRVDQTDSGMIDMGMTSGTAEGFINVQNTGAGHVATAPQFKVLLNASEKMRIDSSGNVGIGTTSPAANLDVAATQPVIRITNTEDKTWVAGNNIGKLEFYTKDSSTPNGTKVATFIQTINEAASAVPSGALTFGVSEGGSSSLPAAEVMRINSQGNVGIGTTSPSDSLHVNGGGILNVGTTNTYAIHMNANSGSGPTLSFGNSTDYDAYGGIQHGSGQFRFLTFNRDYNFLNNGSSLMLIDVSTGRVGIGTTSPSEKLHVDGNGLFTGGIYVNNTSAYLWNTTNGVIRFGTNNLERARIDASGNVGIGTTSPSTKLSVSGNSGERIQIVSTDTSLAADELVGAFEVYKTDASINGAGVFGSLNVYSQDLGGSSYVTLNTSYSDGNNIERVRINAQGNVGIGTTSPSEALHIYRNASSTEIRLQNNTISSYIRSGTDNLNFYVSNGEKVRITSAGNVGIGTTSPSKKLHVNGSFKTTLDGTYDMGILNEYVSTYVTRTKFGNTATTSNLEIYYDIAGAEEARITRNYTSALLKFNRGTTTDMIIDGSGNVGIGTTAPAKKLHVSGGSGSVDNLVLESAYSATGVGVAMQFNRSGGVLSRIRGIEEGSWNGGLLFEVRNGAASNPGYDGATNVAMKIATNGNVGIGTTSPAYKLDVSGDIRATGEVIAYSDARVKENVETIPNALEKVTAMRGVNYNKIGEQKRSTGVIAQELLEILPEAVHQDEEGMYSVAYGNVVGVLIEAIKEQQSRIDEQQKQIDELKKMLG